MPCQTGPPLETLSAGGAAVGGGALLVDLLVVAQEARQAEGFAAGVADVLLALRVDAHVVAQRHVVGVGLVAEVAAEVARLVGVLVVEQGAGVLVGAGAQVAGVRPLVGVHVHGAALDADAGGAAGGGGRGEVLGGAVVSGQGVGRGEAFAAAVALEVHLGPGPLRAFAQAGRGVGGQLPLGAEALPALLAVVLLLGEVEPEVVLHGQPVGVRGVADVAVVLPNFVKVLMVGQAAGVAVRLSALLAREGSPAAFSRVELLRSGSPGGRVGLLEPLVAVLHAHDLTLGGFPSHRLHVGRTGLLKAGTVGTGTDETFGPMLLVEAQVVDELLLNLKSLATFFALVPATLTKLKCEYECLQGVGPSSDRGQENAVDIEALVIILQL